MDILLAELAAAGMHLERDHAAAVINDRVAAVAATLRISATTARRYLDDDAVTGLARRMLFAVVDEHPGADLMKLPRTTVLPLVLVGRVMAGLAEAMQVRAANESPEEVAAVVATYGQAISGMGQTIYDAADSGTADSGTADEGAGREGAGEIRFAPALLRRAARYLRTAAEQLDEGGRLPAGIPETARAGLAAALGRDADGLATLTDPN